MIATLKHLNNMVVQVVDGFAFHSSDFHSPLSISFIVLQYPKIHAEATITICRELIPCPWARFRRFLYTVHSTAFRLTRHLATAYSFSGNDSVVNRLESAIVALRSILPSISYHTPLPLPFQGVETLLSLVSFVSILTAMSGLQRRAAQYPLYSQSENTKLNVHSDRTVARTYHTVLRREDTTYNGTEHWYRYDCPH